MEKKKPSIHLFSEPGSVHGIKLLCIHLWRTSRAPVLAQKNLQSNYFSCVLAGSLKWSRFILPSQHMKSLCTLAIIKGIQQQVDKWCNQRRFLCTMYKTSEEASIRKWKNTSCSGVRVEKGCETCFHCLNVLFITLYKGTICQRATTRRVRGRRQRSWGSSSCTAENCIFCKKNPTLLAQDANTGIHYTFCGRFIFV